jgi:hypothetical protein
VSLEAPAGHLVDGLGVGCQQPDAADSERLQIPGAGAQGLEGHSRQTPRDEAWHEASRLALESGAGLERATRSLDRRAALVGDRLILPGGPLGLALQLIADTESRDVVAVTEAIIALA